MKKVLFDPTGDYAEGGESKDPEVQISGFTQVIRGPPT